MEGRLRSANIPNGIRFICFQKSKYKFLIYIIDDWGRKRNTKSDGLYQELFMPTLNQTDMKKSKKYSNDNFCKPTESSQDYNKIVEKKTLATILI